MSTVAQKPISNRLFMNPLIRKLSKVEEHDPDHCATYSGIAGKTIYFLITLVVGICLCFITKTMTSNGAVITLDDIPDIGTFSISLIEAGVLAVCGLLTILTPILAFLIRPTIPVTGTLYCVATGYLVAWLASTFSGEYAAPVWGALAVTIVLVAVMAILYTTGIVKVNQKLRTVLSTLFFASIGTGILAIIGFLIPFTRPIVQQIQDNYVLSIISAVIFIVIATLFLLVDFDTIRHTVENQLPKKYEWVAAFGLTFTVIWLYFKILDLILKAKEGNK